MSSWLLILMISYNPPTERGGGTWCLFSPDRVLSLNTEQEARSEILDVLDTKTVSLLDILHEVTWKVYLNNDTNRQIWL